MASVTKISAHRNVEQHGLDHAGVFTWDIDADLFFADQAISSLFQIDPHEAERGLPLSVYLDLIHPDDRPRAAKSIRDTILSGGPCQQDYRILQRQGPAIDVMAFGRCFKGRGGGPTHYSGIIHPAPKEPSPTVTLRSHCVAAHATAWQEGETAVAEYLAKALIELNRTKTGDLAAR